VIHRRRRSRKNTAPVATAYLSPKEISDYALAIKLRKNNVINIPGAFFKESDNIEVIDLIARNIIAFERFNSTKYTGRFFKFRMIHEIKGKNDIFYEKSCWVIQGYNDHGKKRILTQSPTIQRMSQRLILAFALFLLRQGCSVELRNIIQAYPQSVIKFARDIYTTLPKELQAKYPSDTIVRMIRPFYGIAEAGVHWWATYHSHHLNEL
jgi:hypothetical protein